MNLVGTMPVRGDDWVLGLSVRVALMWCDTLVVRLHGEPGNAGRILGEIHATDSRLSWVYRADEKWDEMNHRQELLSLARVHGATHIAMIDCDEILSANLLPTIRSSIEQLPRHAMLSLPGYNLRSGLTKYHSNGIWGNRWFSTAFKDDPRAGWHGDKFHHREPEGVSWTPRRTVNHGAGGILHLWGANERRLKAKHALYKLTERLRFPGKDVAKIDQEFSWAIHGEPGHRMYGTPKTWTYADVPASWWAPYAGLITEHLHLDDEPWQESQCRKLLGEHGREKFVGLDLFGVI